MERCGWVNESDALMREYHDSEYGRKRSSDKELFEKLCLEGFQAGAIVCRADDMRVVPAKRGRGGGA